LRCSSRICLLFRILQWSLQNHILTDPELQVALSKRCSYSMSPNPRLYYENFRSKTLHSSNLNPISNLVLASPGAGRGACRGVLCKPPASTQTHQDMGNDAKWLSRTHNSFNPSKGMDLYLDLDSLDP